MKLSLALLGTLSGQADDSASPYGLRGASGKRKMDNRQGFVPCCVFLRLLRHVFGGGVVC